jgi:NTP pyrophosphatase (non-canonical NTP hydrolase)
MCAEVDEMSITDENAEVMRYSLACHNTIRKIIYNVGEEKMNNLDEMTKEVKEFCELRDWDQFHNPKDLAIGLSTEANELLDLFRFKSEQQMKEMMKSQEKRIQISEELGDVFFFLLRFGQLYEFDLKQVLEDKMEKNNKKYPKELVKGKNLKYSEY